MTHSMKYLSLILWTFKYICLFLLICNPFLYLCDDSTKKTDGKISLSVPQLSEEETGSNHMPQHLKCDACMAISYQIKQELNKAQSKKKALKEYDVLEILEDMCNSGFNDYGVKKVDGVNRLSGPGLETESVMGMTQMGGRWPHRIQETCHYLLGEIDEMEIYEAFTNDKEKLVDFMCYRSGAHSHCKHSKIEL